MGWRSLAAAGLLLAAFAMVGREARADVRPVRFQHVSIEDGLSQSTVLCVFQDSRGFVWAGTEDGLNRYDGFSFTVYKHDPADDTTLGHDVIWDIAEDASGNLWLATDGAGLYRWDRSDDRFERIAGDAAAGPALASDYLRTVRFDAHGVLWIGTRDAGLDRLEPATGAVRHHRHDPDDPASVGDDRVYAVEPAADGGLWVATDAGLGRLDPATGEFSSWIGPDALADGRVRAIFDDHRGTVWIGTFDGGLSRLDLDSGDLVHYRHDPDDPRSLSHDRVRAILQDRDQRLWVGTSNGLDVWDDKLRGFAHHRHDRSEPTSMGGDHVIALMQDRGGVLWIGTRTAGLDKTNPMARQFGHYTADPDERDALNNSNVMAFSEDRAGRLWIGTFGGGLNVLDRVSGRISHHLHDDDDPRSLSSDRVTVLIHDHEGTLWVGTLDGGLNRYDARTRTFRRYRNDPDDPASLPADGVMTVFEDRRGVLWVGTFGGGLSRLDRVTGTFTHYQHDPEDPATLSADRVTRVVEDPLGNLWIGTDGGGLNRMDSRSERITRFRHDPDDPVGLSADTVFSLHVDAAGDLWIGTRGGGLDRLRDPAATRQIVFEHYSERDGLPNDVVYGILSDSAGNLWVSTNHGLARFDPVAESFRNYDVNDGLQSNEFHFGAAYRSTSGELYFGGVNGFNAFFPDRLRTNRQPPPVVLTRFLKFNEPAVALGAASEIRHIPLDYDDDVVTFEFAALDYHAPAVNQYAYQLEGFDEQWREVGSVHRVTYTNLDPGPYVFRVRASNSDGVWNEDGLAVSLTVEPPPWRTSTAYVLYTLMLGGGIFAVARLQHRRLAREAAYSRRLEHEVRARTLELAERADELEALNRRLVKASVTDSLTGLANRRFLMEYLEREVSLIRRRYQHAAADPTGDSFDLVLMMVDLDSFKQINDTYGHAAGDRVLIDLRGILEGACRGSDIIVRWGGDEFLVVGRETDPQGIETLAERIRSRIEAHEFTLDNDQVVKTTSSIGFACFPFVRSTIDAVSWEQVVSIADRALYVAKRTCRNAWVGFDSTDRTPLHGLVDVVRNNPRGLIAGGMLSVRTSIDDHEMNWDSPDTLEREGDDPDIATAPAPA